MNNTVATTKVIKDVLLRKMSVQLHEVLRKFAKDNGAPDNFVVKVQPDEKVEFSWEIDKKTFLAEDEDAPAPEPQYDSSHRVYRVATGEVQDGDLAMVQRTFEKWNSDKNRYEKHIGPWLPEIVLPLDTVAERVGHFMHVPGTVSLLARHLTDEERAQIKRI